MRLRPSSAAFKQFERGNNAIPRILDWLPAIGRGRLGLIVGRGWELLVPVGFSIDAVQNLGDGWLKGFFIRLLQPLHIPDQLSLTDQKQINRFSFQAGKFLVTQHMLRGSQPQSQQQPGHR